MCFPFPSTVTLANGVHWAIEQGIKFKQVCLLTDETMIVGRGIDEWAAEHLAKTGIGLLGVESRDTYEDAYARCAPLLAEWNLPVDEWGETTKRTLHGDVLFMPSDTATMSSAYAHTKMLVSAGRKALRRGSMARAKSRGDSGQPCRIPAWTGKGAAAKPWCITWQPCPW